MDQSHQCRGYLLLEQHSWNRAYGSPIRGAPSATQLAFSICYLRGMIRRQIGADLMKFLIRGFSEDNELLEETKRSCKLVNLCTQSENNRKINEIYWIHSQVVSSTSEVFSFFSSKIPKTEMISNRKKPKIT